MYKYKGGGYLQGVPARNLTDEEARGFGIPMLLKGGLYEFEEPEPPAPKEPESTQQPDAEKPGIFRKRRK